MTRHATQPGTRRSAAPRRVAPTARRLTIPCGHRTVLPDERVAGLPPLRRAVGGPPRIDGAGVVPPARRRHPAAPHRAGRPRRASPPSPPTPACPPGSPTRCRPAGRSPGWRGAASRAPGRSSSTAPARRRWAAPPNWCSSPRSPAPGSAAATPGCPGLDPGDVITGPSSVDVKAAGQHAPLWAVPTTDDRAAFVGEAYGVWLWLVMWPMNAAWLLAEQLELLDLRDRIYPDLPARAAERAPAARQPDRNATGASLMIGASPVWPPGTCVTHGTNASAALGRTPVPAGPERPGPARRAPSGGGGEPEEGHHLAGRRLRRLLRHPGAGAPPTSSRTPARRSATPGVLSDFVGSLV